MNSVVTVAVLSAVAAVIGALVGAGATFSMNRANASKMHSEAQKIAQETAFEAWKSNSTILEARCIRCETELGKVQTAVVGLVDAVEAHINEPTADNELRVRTALWVARQAV